MPPRVAPEDPDFWLDDVDETYAWLREHDPVHRYKEGHWVVATYPEVRFVSRDPAAFCSMRGVLVNDPLRLDDRPPISAPSILYMDPPAHVGYRKIVSRAFTPKAVGALVPRIAAITTEMLDAAPLHTEIDLVEQIAVPLPLAVIAEMLGMGDVDRSRFRVWSDETIKAADGLHADLTIVGELLDAIRTAIAAHRGSRRDDVLQLLVDAEVDGERLTDDELLVFCLSLLVAGNETTRNLVAGGLLALAAHPDQRAQLAADPDRIPDAVEEMLRWVTPIKAFARTATRDTDVSGRAISEGDYLILLYASANRDHTAFGSTADSFDVTRRPEPGHVAFGFGEHMCLGASLARLEARILFEQLLARSPAWAITGAPEPVRSTLVNGWSRIEGVLDPVSLVNPAGG